ncbi:MAG: ribonuclease III [Clostridiales bacterium]|nr:ribonuclease III [Clostridiales bacterium]
MTSLEKSIGYCFKNKELLQTALTHSSYANENRISGSRHNERLEFLGDSVLGMAVAFYLYSENPELPEGEMTRLRAELVCEQSLFQAAKSLGLGEYLRLGKGEESGGGRERPSILADAVEALLAAIFLDGGKVEADNFVRRFLVSPILVKGKKTSSDYKTTLQEIIQRKSGNQLSYGIISESGPDHSKSFVAEVLLNGKRIGTGSGKSKKEAEQAAAKNALENNRL